MKTCPKCGLVRRTNKDGSIRRHKGFISICGVMLKRSH